MVFKRELITGCDLKFSQRLRCICLPSGLIRYVNFSVEGGSSMYLQSGDIYLHVHTALQLGRPTSSSYSTMYTPIVHST